jgi:hypothetical protein
MGKMDEKFMFTCDICGKQYQMGRHRYEGKQIPRYKLGVCGTCYESNWDGWGPLHEAKFIAHLKKHNIPIPERNEKGWFPRD